MLAANSLASVATILFLLIMAYAGIMDLFTLRIRNVLVLAVVALWAVAAPLAGMSPVDIGLSIAAAGIVFVLSGFFFALGWIGAGDAKLASAVALWFGWQDAFSYFVLASLFGGLLSLAIIVLRTRWGPLGRELPRWLARLRDVKRGVPYGAAFAAAAFVLFSQTDWYARLA
ncbi:prepilin peptidase [Afifella sp. IM 167]|uniref:A24 family peptidase n=1 Tax=Afifella sp. IM 167 TaxID=2033586 RepID=UPI001CC9835A|nr:prepilin peptidase [Afifella sp. IM 167]